MHNAYVVTGQLEDRDTIKLDEELPLADARVRLIIEPAETNNANGTSANGANGKAPKAKRRSYEEVMEEIHAAQRARGHVPPTKEEVDAYLEAERASWD